MFQALGDGTLEKPGDGVVRARCEKKLETVRLCKPSYWLSFLSEESLRDLKPETWGKRRKDLSLKVVRFTSEKSICICRTNSWWEAG